MAPPAECTTYHFSTRVFPERERLAAWRETFGRTIARVESHPLGDQPFHGEADFLVMPGAAIGVTTLSPMYGVRTPELTRDGRDDVGLMVPTSGKAFASQRGREVVINEGAGVVMRAAEPACFGSPTTFRTINLVIPEAILGPLVSDCDSLSTSVIAADNAALRLLVGYMELLRGQPELITPATRHLAATHIQDLIALAIGATRDAAEVAAGRGLRVARLAAIKADIGENLGRPNLSVADVARRQGISPIYVRKLFESEGTTFTEFVRGRRLVEAYRRLTDPEFVGTITAVALEVGFADLSYFNRCFRRQFGACPSEIRMASRSRD